jgi:hypothetical protein
MIFKWLSKKLKPYIDSFIAQYLNHCNIREEQIELRERPVTEDERYIMETINRGKKR